MIAYLPIPGGHIKLAGRFVNPALSFTMGWNYWYNWTIIGIFDLRPCRFSPSDSRSSSWYILISVRVVMQSHIINVLQPSYPLLPS